MALLPAPPVSAAPPLGRRADGAKRAAYWVAGALILIQALVAAVNLSPIGDRYTVKSLFDVNGEANVVAWLSSAALLLTAAGAGLAAAADRAQGAPRRLWVGWALVAALFTLLSLDEAARLHELAGEKAHHLIDLEALPSLYTWVLVAAPVGVAAALLLDRWIRRVIGLRTPTGRLTLAAIILWLGVPALEALDPSLGGPLVLSVIEESLEAVGEALMLAGVLVYLGTPGRFTALAARGAGSEPSER